MDIQKAEAVLQQVAHNHGKDISEIKQAIELAIQDAMHSGDLSVQGYWRLLLVDGRKPTAVELVAQLGEFICAVN